MERKRCLGCRYRRPATAMNPRETICHYLLDTGHLRGCPAADCNRWQPQTGFFETDAQPSGSRGEALQQWS